MSDGPFKMQPVANESMAANRVYQTFGELAESVDTTSWGDFAVGVTDARGFRHVRIVERERSSQPGRGRDSSMAGQLFNRQSMISDLRRAPYAMPSMEVGNVRLIDSVSGAKPPVPLEERDEGYLLAAMDTLSGRILPLDSALALEIGDLHQRITRFLKGRERERRAAARAECDRLTAEGREALATLRKLESERSMTQDDRNRVIIRLNGAKQKLQAVKQGRPHDSEFPTETELDDWQAKFDAAKAEADELQRQVDELRDEYRRQGAGVSLARQRVNQIRAERNAARTRAGIRTAGEQQDGDEIEEGLREA